VLRFTGHPLVDVGIAALTAFADQAEPQALTPDDLMRAARWLESQYATGAPLGGLARGMLVLNSGYFNANRPAYVQRVLYGWTAETPRLETPCSFCGAPATYRANREDIPLLNGRAIINFSPAGQAGLPVCGTCSLALHMLPLGCFKSGKGLVAVHSEDPMLTLDFARENLRHLQQILTLPVEQLPGLPFPRTRLVEQLVRWLVRVERRGLKPASLTAYFFSNNGADPFIDIYRVDACALRFLEDVLHPADLDVRRAWERAVERAWVHTKKLDSDDDLRPNRLYEALLRLPQGAVSFLRRYLLPVHCWGLVERYLRKVMNMQETDIALLRQVGSRLAEYARAHNRFFYDFSRIDDYSRWRRAVLRAADDAARQTGQPLLSFDEFVALFTYREGEYWDWRLARDLITLLMIEARAVPDAEALFDDESLTQEDA
jgi:CRISPR-associated protein Cst1